MPSKRQGMTCIQLRGLDPTSDLPTQTSEDPIQLQEAGIGTLT